MVRGLRRVNLVISDAHVGIRAAVAKVLKSTWQRCRVHFLRSALAHAGKGQRQMVLAMINTAFNVWQPPCYSSKTMNGNISGDTRLLKALQALPDNRPARLSAVVSMSPTKSEITDS